MSPRHDLLLRYSNRLAIVVALLVALGFPVGSFFLAYNDLASSLDFKAQVKASILNNLVANVPDIWMFAENRIQGLIAHQPAAPENEWIEVLDINKQPITAAGQAQSRPALTMRRPLQDGSKDVGFVLVSQSLRPVFQDSLLVALASALLGLLIYFGLRLGPLRALRRVSDELFEEKERAEITLKSIGDAVITTDAQEHIVFVNPVAEKMLGRSMPDLKGKALASVLHLKDSATGLPIDNVLRTAMQLHSAATCEGRSVLITPRGERIDVEQRATPMLDVAGQVTSGLLSLHDVSAIREYLRLRTWEASHDALTELANRREFTNRVSAVLTDAQVNRTTFVLCYMDLDRFKLVNDNAGHAAGDALLVQLAGVMKAHIRNADILARLGGDEFGLLLDGCDMPRALLIANDLVAAVSNYQFHYNGLEFSVGLSVGLTAITHVANSAAELFKEADSACRWAKEQGRNRVCVYEHSNQEMAAKRSESSWAGRVSAALRNNGFVLYHQVYRPLSDSAGDRVHLKVLIRMVNLNGSIVLPGKFLPSAERFGLMPDIDRWVIRQVFDNFSKYQESQGGAPLMVTVNVSGPSIHEPELLDFIKQHIDSNQVDPGSICLEVSETVALRNLRQVDAFMRAGRKLGLKFSLNDFGATTNAFNYLKDLPVDYLKISGACVREMRTDAMSLVLTESIHRIGKILGKVTVGDFAEDEITIEGLRDMGVDFAQGYGVGQPQML